MIVLAIATIYGDLLGGAPDDYAISRQGDVILNRPLKLVQVQTPKGTMNSFMPVSQLVPLTTLRVPEKHIVACAEASAELRDVYLQMTTGIAMPGAGSRIQLGG